MNTKPEIPDTSCPVPVVDTGYYTNEQSYLNVARKDKFRLVVAIPKTLRPFFEKENRKCSGMNLDKLHYNIWGNVLPEVSVPAIKETYGGQTLKFSSFSRPEYPAIQVTFSIDDNFDNYYVIWKWLALMNDPAHSFYNAGKTGRGQGFLHDYSIDFTLQVLQEYDKVVAEFTYTDAFPVALGDINYSKRDSGEIECNFTFEFSQLLMKMV